MADDFVLHRSGYFRDEQCWRFSHASCERDAEAEDADAAGDDNRDARRPQTIEVDIGGLRDYYREENKRTAGVAEKYGIVIGALGGTFLGALLRGLF